MKLNIGLDQLNINKRRGIHQGGGGGGNSININSNLV